MNKYTRWLTGIFTFVLAVVGVQLAYARTLPALAGRLVVQTDDACVRWTQAVGVGDQWGLQNICTHPVIGWEIGLPVDTARSYTVTVRAVEDGAGGFVNCLLFVIDPNGKSVTGGNRGPLETVNTANVYQSLTFTSPSVPSGGTMFVHCNISASTTAKLLSVDWF
jgi:hypothetical protein